MTAKIMLVDDEEKVLFAYQRQLYKKYQVVAVQSGAQGLAALEKSGPFAVVVSDYRMPQMDGVEFLSRVAEKEPRMVRVMLTGYADTQLAVNAINDGKIFRFLNKPCPADVFLKTIEAGVEQYKLVTAEQELLNKTLKGSIKLLTEILSITNPEAFGKAARLSRQAKALAVRLMLQNPLEIELAAMLSQIGCVTIPAAILLKIYNGLPLNEKEEQVYRAHPQTAKKLLAHIPRLEEIANAVAYQFKHFDGNGFPEDGVKGTGIPLTGRILKVATDFEFLMQVKKDSKVSLAQMQKQKQQYDPDVFAALEAEVYSVEEGYIVRSISLKQLCSGMVMAADIRDKGGTTLVPRGFEITELIKMRLSNYANTGSVQEPLKVLEKATACSLN